MPTLQKFSTFKELKETEAKTTSAKENKQKHESFEKLMRKLMNL